MRCGEWRYLGAVELAKEAAQVIETGLYPLELILPQNLLHQLWTCMNTCYFRSWKVCVSGCVCVCVCVSSAPLLCTSLLYTYMHKCMYVHTNKRETERGGCWGGGGEIKSAQILLVTPTHPLYSWLDMNAF